jgi:hypothetical protein
MKIRRFFIAICATIQLFAADVPLGHWVYDVLERFEAKGHITGFLSGAKPYSRQDLYHTVKQLSTTFEQNPQRFSALDEEWLKEMQREFLDWGDKSYRDDNNRIAGLKQSIIFAPWLPEMVYENNRNLLRYQFQSFEIFVDPILRFISYEPLLRGEQRKLLHMSNGFYAYGRMGSGFAFHFDLTDNTIWGEQGLLPGETWIKNSGWPWVNTNNEEKLMYDENVFGVSYQNDWLSLSVGRQYSQWGYGKAGQLSVSSHSPAMDMVRWSLDFGRFKYTGLTGFLIDVDASQSVIRLSDKRNKFLAGSRIEFNAGFGLQLGLNQFAIYGDRDLELGYHVPFAFLKSGEHYYGDRDNGAISLDFEWSGYLDTRLYGELFFDDISIGKFGSGFYGNKFAYTIGAEHFGANLLDGLEGTAEYTHIEPYVYTHKVSVNVYKHYDSNLGHWLYPNSDLQYYQLRYWLNWRFLLQATYRFIRHGRNPADRNVGGDIDVPFSTGDNETVEFLDGDLEKRQMYKFELYYEVLRRTRIFVGYAQEKYDPGDSFNSIELGFEINYGQK